LLYENIQSISKDAASLAGGFEFKISYEDKVAVLAELNGDLRKKAEELTVMVTAWDAGAQSYLYQVWKLLIHIFGAKIFDGLTLLGMVKIFLNSQALLKLARSTRPCYLP